jgi:hypothetical protein
MVISWKAVRPSSELNSNEKILWEEKLKKFFTDPETPESINIHVSDWSQLWKHIQESVVYVPDSKSASADFKVLKSYYWIYIYFVVCWY